jgi:hypothetical protein
MVQLFKRYLKSYFEHNFIYLLFIEQCWANATLRVGYEGVGLGVALNDGD